MIRKILYRYLKVDSSHHEYRYLTVLVVGLLSACIADFSFLIFNIFTGKYPLLIAAEAIAFLLCALGLYLLLVQRKVNTAAFILLFVCMAVCFITMLFVGNKSYSLALAALCPVLSLFILGFRLGCVFSILFFIAFSWLCLSNLGVWQPAAYTLVSYVQMTMIYAFLFVVTSFYELSRVNAHRLLTESNLKLQMLVSTDVLTGAKNRRYLEDILLNLQLPSYFAMVDVDDFKHINDNYGHFVGDAVLKELTTVMESSIGERGIIARWGGEEFAILFENLDQHCFEDIINKLIIDVAEHAFSFGKPVTISVGGGLLSPSNHKASLLKVDAALYDAKANGKNCVKFSY